MIHKLDDIIANVKKALDYVDYESTRLLNILHNLYAMREEEIFMYNSAKEFMDANILYTP